MRLPILIIIGLLFASCSMIQYKNMMIRQCMKELADNDVPAKISYQICKNLYRPKIDHTQAEVIDEKTRD